MWGFNMGQVSISQSLDELNKFSDKNRDNVLTF